MIWLLGISTLLSLFCIFFSPYSVKPARTILKWEMGLLFSAFRAPFALILLGICTFHILVAIQGANFILQISFGFLAFADLFCFCLLTYPLLSFLFDQSHFDFELRQVFPTQKFRKYEASFWALFAFPNMSLKGRKSYDFVNRRQETLQIDLWKIENPKAPCVIQFFGGGYTVGNKNQFPHFNRFLNSLGYHVLALPYQLMPKHRWPTQLHDVIDAYHYFKNNLPVFGIDPEFLIFSGRSAGAHVGLCAYQELRDPLIKGFLSFYNPVDFEFLLEYSYPGDILNSEIRLGSLFGTPLRGNALLHSASPQHFLDSKHPAFLNIHGRADCMVPVKVTERFSERLDQLKVPHFNLYLDYEDHAFELSLNSPGGQKTCYAIERFLTWAKEVYSKTD